MSSCITMPSLETLLANVAKNRSNLSVTRKIGSSKKSIDFQAAIAKLNAQYGTDFYLERDRQSFTIQGHREFGVISRRSGILGINVDMTLGGEELHKAGNENTIKMIVDDKNNFIVVSLIDMKKAGILDKDQLSQGNGVKNKKDGRFFYSWSIQELKNIDAILYYSMEFHEG
jgi:hypothetical protein